MKHFRIIELPERQVLLTKDFNEDNDYAPMLCVDFFMGDVRVTQKITAKTQEAVDKIFDGFTDKVALSLVQDCENMIE